MSATRRVLAAAALALAGFAAQAQDVRVEAVRFAPGASGATIEDTIVGYETVSYEIGAMAGQVLDLQLAADNAATYFNLYGPGAGPGDEALARSEMQPEINRFTGALPASGTYTVSVFLYRSAARRGERSRYTLTVAIPPADLAAPVEGDFADGLAGGPDFWEVRSSGMLNLRAAPSTGAAVAARAEPGQVLRNLGCRMAEGRRWCQVEALDGAGGWAAGEFLGESDYVPEGMDGTPAANPPMIAGEGYDATSVVPCRLAPDAAPTSCALGVVRDGGGSGLVTVDLPDGIRRVIVFEGGAAVDFDRAQSDGDLAFSATRQEDNTLVRIGPQSVLIPDAVIWGG